MNLHKQNFVCWPSVGPQDIKQTYIHTYIHTYVTGSAYLSSDMRFVNKKDRCQLSFIQLYCVTACEAL